VKTLIRIFLALVAQSGFASIGETLDQCASRYGRASGDLSRDQITFVRDHVTIVVHARDGRSIQEDFAPEGGATLSDSQIAEFLQENSEGSTWEKTGETASVITYNRKDGRATAQCAKPNDLAPNTRIKLAMNGAELVVKYTATGAAQ
jgi:hypothetical protein